MEVGEGRTPDEQSEEAVCSLAVKLDVATVPRLEAVHGLVSTGLALSVLPRRVEGRVDIT